MMKTTTLALALCLLGGCSSAPPASYGVCAAQPGSYACQIERYENAF